MTDMLIHNFQPVPFNSLSNFVATDTPTKYSAAALAQSLL